MNQDLPYPVLGKSQTLREVKQMLSDKIVFLSKFIQSPKRVGSLTPSSPFLAQKMMQTIDWNHIGSIVELGAGTGVFTRYISELKHPDCKGIVFEQDDQMRERLQQQYENLSFHSNAEDLYATIQKLGVSEVDCVLSGLPFSNFPPGLRESIIQAVVRSLKPGGLFVAFQYSLQMRSLLKKHFTNVDLTFVPLNIPPAFVYRCSK